jgi:acetolactate synthase I/II/III large subunit
LKIREAIADALAGEGASVLFALMGDANQDLIVDLAERHGLRVVHGRHEQGVAGMADGYARFSGQPGYATVTQGPGLTNAATSLTVAQRHGSPVLMLAGDAPLGDAHNPQWFDQAELGRITTRSTGRLESAHHLDDVLAAAFGAVRRGHAHLLNLPADVQQAELPDGWAYAPRYALPQHVCPDPQLAGTAADLLAGARQPAILAGRGAIEAGSALAALGELLAAPLATTLLAKGLFRGHPLDAGVCGGLGDGRALRALDQCDVVLAAGASLNQWTTHFGSALDGRRVIQVDADLSAFGAYRHVDVALHGDAAGSVSALTALIRQRQDDPAPLRGDLRAILADNSPADPSPYLDTEYALDPRHALAALDSLLPARRNIVIGGGHSAQIACMMLPASGPADWTCTSVDFAALGQSLPVALGACFARPGERVYLVTADGELMMGLAEFDTAIRYRLPLTVIVLNDRAFGQERHNLAGKGLPLTYAEHPAPDLAALAAAFGARGYRVGNADQLDVLGKALTEADGTVLIDVAVNPEYLNPVSRDIASHLG